MPIDEEKRYQNNDSHMILCRERPSNQYEIIWMDEIFFKVYSKVLLPIFLSVISL